MWLEGDPQGVDRCVCVTEVSSGATRTRKSKFTAEVNARAEEKSQFVSLTLRVMGSTLVSGWAGGCGTLFGSFHTQAVLRSLKFNFNLPLVGS